MIQSDVHAFAVHPGGINAPFLEGQGSVYCEDCNIAVRWSEDLPPYSGIRFHTIDRDIATKLWVLSEEMTGVRFAA
jgi:hypothetical protein